MIQKYDGPCAGTRKNDAKVIARSVRAYRKQGFVDPGFGVKVFQVALKIVPGTMERPGAKLLQIANTDAAELQVAHRKKAHYNAFFIAMADIQREGIRLWMTTVVLQEKLPVIRGQFVTNIHLEGGDLCVRCRAGR